MWPSGLKIFDDQLLERLEIACSGLRNYFLCFFTLQQEVFDLVQPGIGYLRVPMMDHVFVKSCSTQYSAEYIRCKKSGYFTVSYFGVVGLFLGQLISVFQYLSQGGKEWKKNKKPG